MLKLIFYIVIYVKKNTNIHNIKLKLKSKSLFIKHI